MDGTFRVMSEPFKPGQLMSIHGFIHRDDAEKQVPMAFVLMSRRKTEDYVAVFRRLTAELDELSVEGFVLDFEAAAWQAVRAVFPHADLQGCVFHWTQAVWRRAVDCGLKPAYSQRSSIYQYIRQLLALPFLPSNHAAPTFQNLKEKANTSELRRLVQYVEDQWFLNSVFPVQSWCIFGKDVRTNNDVEGWHHRLNSRAGHTGLTFYKLVPVLRKEAEMVAVQLRLVTEGHGRRAPRTAYRQLDLKIRKLWGQYSEGIISTGRLLRGCARLYGPSED